MAVEIKPITRVIDIHEGMFDAAQTFSSLKEKLKELGYTLFEKKHKEQKTAYGKFYYVELIGKKSRDSFGASRIDVTVTFSDLKDGTYQGKKVSKGNCNVVIKGIIILDQKNQYNAQPFTHWLFTVYTKTIGKALMKKKYIVPTIIETESLYTFAKEQLYLYS